ncbi:MAG: DUF364 domain-containing protein [Candidatus Bathyarchaeia archaeon]
MKSNHPDISMLGVESRSKWRESMYQTLRDQFEGIVRQNNLWKEKVEVTVKTPSEAIGTPKREDFPLLKGKERIVEARFKDSRGQAFTDAYVQFSGDLKEVLSIDLTNNENRAIFIATLNAVMKHLGLVDGTTHCKDEEPETCSRELVDYISKNFGDPKIAMIGYQPQMVEALSGRFTIRVTDLNRENIGTMKDGVKILDGEADLDETVEWSDLVLATGSTIVNGTIERIIEAAGHKPLIFYGITIAGPAKLLGLNRFCIRVHA